MYEELKLDIYDIHMSIDEKEFQNKTNSLALLYICDYIKNQWLDGDFNKWQIFRNKPGYAKTNSNIESFNAAIKRDFTGRARLNMKKALEKVKEIIIYYSKNSVDFELSLKKSRQTNNF